MPAVPYLKLAAVHDARSGCLNLLALNRSLDQELALNLTAAGFAGLELTEALTLHAGDLDASNSKEAPDRIKPIALEGIGVEGGHVRGRLPAASWNVVCLRVSG